MNLARAFRWQALIDSGTYSNTTELAEATGKDPAYISRIIRLTLLAPEIVHAVLAGNLTAIRPAGKAAQRDADPLGGPEEALRGGVKWREGA